MFKTFYLSFIFRCSLLSLTIFLSSCASFKEEQILDPKVYYRHDITLDVNGQERVGVLVAKPSSEYDIKIEAPGKIDLIKITSCHRQFSTEDVPDGWFKSGKKFGFKYKPIEGIETHGSCMLKLEAYEAGVEGRHSSGLIEFETPEETLPAKLRCNGTEQVFRGVSICQSWEGLVQEISFEVPVKTSSHLERCKIPKSDDQKTWLFRMPNRECTYLFKEIGGQERMHRFQAIGYEEIPIRGKL